VAPRRPAVGTDSGDPAYDFRDVDEFVRNAQQRGLEVLLTIWGTPRWANGGRPKNVAPDDPDDLRDFAGALAERYSGRHPGYPFVRFYTVWNEPNLPAFLSPQYDLGGNSVAPATYARLYRAGYAGIKAASPLARVALGDTSPWGGVGAGSHSPGAFAHALSELAPDLRFDAWAHHPYATAPDLPPSQRVRWPNVTLTQLPRFERVLARWWHRPSVPIWITEYDYRTRPQAASGVTYAAQAQYLEDALGMAAADPNVSMFVWYVLRDDPQGPWPSGLVAQNGRRKPAFRVFARAARSLDARAPIVDAVANVRPWVHVSARHLAWYDGSGGLVGLRYRITDARGRLVARRRVAARIGLDEWLRFRLRFRPKPGRYTVRLDGADVHGNRLAATLSLVAR